MSESVRVLERERERERRGVRAGLPALELTCGCACCLVLAPSAWFTFTAVLHCYLNAVLPSACFPYLHRWPAAHLLACLPARTISISQCRGTTATGAFGGDWVPTSRQSQQSHSIVRTVPLQRFAAAAGIGSRKGAPRASDISTVQP